MNLIRVLYKIFLKFIRIVNASAGLLSINVVFFCSAYAAEFSVQNSLIYFSSDHNMSYTLDYLEDSSQDVEGSVSFDVSDARVFRAEGYKASFTPLYDKQGLSSSRAVIGFDLPSMYWRSATLFLSVEQDKEAVNKHCHVLVLTSLLDQAYEQKLRSHLLSHHIVYTEHSGYWALECQSGMNS